MKEYLVKNIRGDYVATDHHSGFQVEDLIEIPEGSDFASVNDTGLGMMFFPQEGCLNDPEQQKIEGFKVVWERDKTQVVVDSGNVIKPIKSDGGSSSYYFTSLPEHLIKDIVERGGIEIKDIVRYCFDNDADCKDIIKALKRIRENLKGGGKEGVDSIYDMNKIVYFAKEQLKAEQMKEIQDGC